MGLSGGGDKTKEIKFLVDLQSHTYISEKSHQEIIDLAHLNPGGYDNYLKGWVKNDGTIKIWVETIEDIVFRYWDQMKLGFRMLMKEKLVIKESRLYAIVNRIERFAGEVQHFMGTSKKMDYLEEKLGYAVQFYGTPQIAKGSPVLLLVNYRVAQDRYLLAGTRGTILSPATARSKNVRVLWQSSISGTTKPRGKVELLTDRRILSPM